MSDILAALAYGKATIMHRFQLHMGSSSFKTKTICIYVFKSYLFTFSSCW